MEEVEGYMRSSGRGRWEAMAVVAGMEGITGETLATYHTGRELRGRRELLCGVGFGVRLAHIGKGKFS